jgi:hypothetical protein
MYPRARTQRQAKGLQVSVPAEHAKYYIEILCTARISRISFISKKADSVFHHEPATAFQPKAGAT